MEVEISQKDGSRLSKADFEVVRREVISLSQRPEGLQPKDLLERARPTTSPLHKFFEWDDREAAEKYRLEQARKLIYTVTIRVIEDGKEPIRGNFAIRVIDIESGTSTYRPLHEAMNDPLQRAQIVRRAMEEYAAWENRYHHLEELKDLFEAGDTVRRKIQNLLRRATTVVRRRARE